MVNMVYIQQDKKQRIKITECGQQPTISNHPSSQATRTRTSSYWRQADQHTVLENRDQTIKKLEQKNQRLMIQIQKVQKVLEQPLQKIEYGNKLPQLNSKVTQQQLQNAYKQIRSYQYEIKKLRGVAKDGTYVDQIKKNQALLKEKEELSQKLRKQLFDIKKQSMELTKCLKNDNIKQEYQTKSTKLNSQIKWLREKVRELQTKQNMNKDNRQKQLAFIKKLQTSLAEQGFPIGTIRILRQKYAPAKQNPNQSYYSTARRTASKTTPNNRSSYAEESEKEQVIEDRTPQAYTSLMSQVKLLQKMQKDYQNQTINLEKQKEEAANINLNTRNKLVEVEEDIDRVENRINQLKKMIDPSKIKPTRGLSMPNTSRYGDINRPLGAVKAAFQHLYRNQQVGKLSRQGRRFGDRIKLGKTESRIVAIDFYQLKQTGNVVGLQATYQIKKTIKKGPLNMIIDQKLTSKKSVILYDNDDYVKSFECICNDKGGIIGIALMSNKGVTGRAGPMQGNRRPLNMQRNQYPVCLYGSFTQNGIELFGSQVLQQKSN